MLIGFLGNRSIDGWLFDWASGLVTLTRGLLLLVTMPIMPKPQPIDAPRRPPQAPKRETLQLASPTPRPVFRLSVSLS